MDIVMDDMHDSDALLNELEELQSDPFWDFSSDIRCSSPDPTKYYDPSTVQVEHNGRAVSSLVPTGTQSIIIPRSTRFGGSLGFNANSPTVINVDPHIAGGASVVDLSRLTKEAIDKAMAETSHIPDAKFAAAAAYRKLAISTQPVGAQTDAFSMAAAGNGSGAYVVPGAKSTITKQSQVLTPKAVMTPIVKTPIPEIIEQTDIQELPKETPKPKSLSSAFEVKSIVQSSVPTEELTLEIPGFGMLTTSYHKIIRDGVTLALIYDNSYKGGNKFIPKENKNPILTDVHSSDKIYKIVIPGIQFNLKYPERDVDFDIYIVLIVDEAAKEK